MKILYYRWKEFNYEDIVEALKNMGHEVCVVQYIMKDYCVDNECYSLLEDELGRASYDMIFSVDFFPLIAKLSYSKQMIYVSWIYDKPHWTMYSDMIFSPFNRIFTFDQRMCDEFRKYGVEHIYYLPLAVNVKRLRDMLQMHSQEGYADNITFMGTLTSDTYSQIDQIKGLPDYMKGYIQGICNAQLQIYGYNMIEELVTQQMTEEIQKYADFNMGEEFFVKDEQIIASMIAKKATMIERNQIVKKITKKYRMALYSGSEPEDTYNIDYRGYADYYTQMPYIFHQSRINLNITMRSIDAGVPLRAFDIMGAGGFLLSNYQSGLAELFEHGSELVMYESQDDMMGKIEYYLAHEKERAEIACNGQRKVEQCYSYENQLQKMMNIVEETA